MDLWKEATVVYTTDGSTPDRTSRFVLFGGNESLLPEQRPLRPVYTDPDSCLDKNDREKKNVLDTIIIDFFK